MPLSLSAAKAVADHAVTYVLADPELVSALLSMTGVTPADLRQMIGKDELSQACLEVIMQQDDRVIDFAAQIRYAPQDVSHAHQLLVGPVWG